MLCIKILQQYNEYGEVIAKFGKKNYMIGNVMWTKYLCMDHDRMYTFALSLLLPDHGISFERIQAKQTELVSMQMRHGPEDAQLGNRNDNNETRGGNNYSTTLSVARTFEDVARLQWRINRDKSKRAKENLTGESYMYI